MKSVFHFKISFQVDQSHSHQFSGIFTTTWDPADPTFYHQTMAELASRMDPPRDPTKCILESMSLLKVES